MERNVKKTVYSIVILLFTFSIGCKAQIKFEDNIEFNHKDGTKQLHILRSIGRNYEPNWIGDDCYQGMETFNFSVNSNGKVINITHEGSLPNYMVEPMIKAIQGLDDKWIIHKETTTTVYNFKLPLIIHIGLKSGCGKSKYSHYKKEDYVEDLYKKISPNSYEIYPYFWSAIR